MMKYSAKEIESRLRTGEDSVQEFKQVEFSGDQPKRPSRSDWADEIAAFANSGGGLVFAGVSDDGNAIGMSRNQVANLNMLLAEVCTDTIKPPVRVQIYHCELIKDKFVLLVEVPAGDTVHDSPGGQYIRVGSSKRLMERDEYLRLAQQRSQARFLWFDKQLVPKTGVGQFSANLWKPLLSSENAAEPIVGLHKLALLGGEHGHFKATVAGILLCTPNPDHWLPNACITATCYRGEDRSSGQLDAKEITGPLNQQISEAAIFALRHNQVGARKDPARVNLPQYSQKAIFEALVNAVAHRDYSISGSRIRLSMFSDRLEIRSPGSLPNNLTVDTIVSRQSARNEALVSVLSRMPVNGTPCSEDRLYFMERRGDGVPIIRRETWELCGQHPEYRVIDNAEVLLIIPAALPEPSPDQVIVSVWSDSKPLPEVELLFIYPNKTRIHAFTDSHGRAAIDLHTTHLPMTVFAAAPKYSAHLECSWIPRDRGLAIELHSRPRGGSVIFTQGHGTIAELNGWIQVVRDPHDRTLIHSSDILVNKVENQPVYYALGEDLQLKDTQGNEVLLRVVEISGRSALIEYSPQKQACS